jgi:CheY-like chemotaxis protein
MSQYPLLPQVRSLVELSGKVMAVNDVSERLVLLVDDEPSIRESVGALLTDAGYEVSTAAHGFDALLQLRTLTPDVIISDLNMPQMSGFEFLSVVRRRFPEIPLIAFSGAYDSTDHVPGGVIADAFYAKGQHQWDELLRIIANLIQTSGARTIDPQRKSAPIWIPRNAKDSTGAPFIVLTCTECLRSFPLSVVNDDVQDVQEALCLFCASPVRYIIDFSFPVSSLKHDTTDKRSGIQSRATEP